MEIEEKPSANEETYHVYNYFKERPGILLSAVSVLTAVLAVVANALAFLYQYIKLQKWNINILKWGLPFEGNTIYYPALSLLYILLVFCLCYVTLQIFEVAFSSYALYAYLECIRLNNEAKYFPHSESWLTEDGIKNLKKDWNSLIFPKSLLALLIYALLIFTQQLLTDNFYFFSPPLVVAYIFLLIIIFLSSFFLAFVDNKEFFPNKKLRKALRKATKNPTCPPQSILTEEEFTICLGKCGTLLANSKKKRRFSDQNLSRYMILVAAVFVTEIVSVCFTAIATTENDFWIYTDSQSSYVVAYRHDSQYVLTEVQISDSTITIDLSSQRILQSDDLTIQQRQFEDVIWEKGDQS